VAADWVATALIMLPFGIALVAGMLLMVDDIVEALYGRDPFRWELRQRG